MVSSAPAAHFSGSPAPSLTRVLELFGRAAALDPTAANKTLQVRGLNPESLIHGLSLQGVQPRRRPFVPAGHHAGKSQGFPSIQSQHIGLVAGFAQPFRP